MKTNKIIAVDFDGTCLRHEYPEIGADVPHAARVLKRLNEAKVRIIVWKMRSGEHLEVGAKDWFEERGIGIWAYNNNPGQASWTESPKCYAQAYIDDAAIGYPLIYPDDGTRSFVDWLAVEKLLEDGGFL